MMRLDLYIISPVAGRWLLTLRGQDLAGFPTRDQATRAALAMAQATQDAEVVALNEDGTAESIWAGNRSEAPSGLYTPPFASKRGIDVNVGF